MHWIKLNRKPVTFCRVQVCLLSIFHLKKIITFIVYSVCTFFVQLADEVNGEMNKANDAIENAKNNLNKTANKAVDLAEQTKDVADNILSRTKEVSEGALVAGAKAAEKAAEKQLGHLEEAFDSGLKQAGDVAHQKIHDANTNFDHKREELEKVIFYNYV